MGKIGSLLKKQNKRAWRTGMFHSVASKFQENITLESDFSSKFMGIYGNSMFTWHVCSIQRLKGSFLALAASNKAFHSLAATTITTTTTTTNYSSFGCPKGCTRETAFTFQGFVWNQERSDTNLATSPSDPAVTTAQPSLLPGNSQVIRASHRYCD